MIAFLACRVVNETGIEIDEGTLCHCVAEVLALSETESLAPSEVKVPKKFPVAPARNAQAGKKTLNVVISTEEEMSRLNSQYFGKDTPTDVLSFPSGENIGYLGEIVVCPSFIKKQVQENFKWELCHVVVHGTFHLLGIHHEQKGQNGYKVQHEKEVQIVDRILKLKG